MHRGFKKDLRTMLEDQVRVGGCPGDQNLSLEATLRDTVRTKHLLRDLVRTEYYTGRVRRSLGYVRVSC